MITAVKINVSGGHTLALQHGGQNYFLLVSCWTFNSYPPMCFKRYHITFSTFSLKFKCKICVKKEVIHNFKNHTLVTWPASNLLILRKWCRFEKPNHYPLIIFRRQNHITFWIGYMSYPRRRVSRTSFCTFVTFILPTVISLLHFLNAEYSEQEGASKNLVHFCPVLMSNTAYIT